MDKKSVAKMWKDETSVKTDKIKHKNAETVVELKTPEVRKMPRKRKLSEINQERYSNNRPKRNRSDKFQVIFYFFLIYKQMKE